MTWSILEDVAYREKFISQLEGKVPVSDFPDTVKDLQKKQITVSGYMIPTDHSRKIMVLSTNPYEHCYLRVKGSPVSVMVMSITTVSIPRRYRADPGNTDFTRRPAGNGSLR